MREDIENVLMLLESVAVTCTIYLMREDIENVLMLLGFPDCQCHLLLGEYVML